MQINIRFYLPIVQSKTSATIFILLHRQHHVLYVTLSLPAPDLQALCAECACVCNHCCLVEIASSSALGGGDNIVMNLLSQLCGSFFQESPLASVFGKNCLSCPHCYSSRHHLVAGTLVLLYMCCRIFRL